jgi:catechol 2,3-dioxygenase-like lactoylglutathione lyase family enzyme
MDIVAVGLLIPVVTSVTYFFLSKEPELYKRAISSSHGALLLVSMGYAMLASQWSSFHTWQFYIWLFYLILIAFVLSIGYSLFRFRGTKLVHLLQLCQLPVAFWYWVIGTMAITHDSIQVALSQHAPRGRAREPRRAKLHGRAPVGVDVRRQGDIMTVKRMDNVGIVVEDIDAAIEFFTELGLELEGRAPIEGDWADGVTGLRDMRVEIAMMRTPDGHSRLEMSRFLAPPVVADHRSAPVNALGYLRVMFTVEDIDDTLARLGKRGAELVGEVVQYEDTYRLCYIRGPEGILIGLAQELGQHTSR